MAAITFEIAGEPVAKARARAGKFGHYTPEKTRRYEFAVGYAASQAMGARKPFDEALAVTITAIIPIPQSWSRKRQDEAERGLILPVSRPDADNFAKAVLDGANAIVWRDDSVVVDLHVRKKYGDRPRVIVTVEAIA